jgi:parallel beta-helix repeat protein
VRFEDCHVEGAMRATDEILAETSGLAVQLGFRTAMKNRQGEARVIPGYMKALSEDGFRTYGQHRNLSLRNCTAVNMRGGFELRTKAGVRLENCTATGCERGFWISSGAVVVRCRGDAQYGPLLFAEGDNASVDLELSPAKSKMNVHAVAAIYGTGNKVALKPSPGGSRTRPAPILVGYGPPGMGEGMSPIPEKAARGLTLTNETTMPVVIGAQAGVCVIVTRGPVQENKGKDIAIKRLP